jgi:hypothetical protein
VGRELLGFPKELTQFCVDRGADVEPLSWDGYTKGENPEKRPLYQVSQVRVVRNLNETTTPTDTLLKLNYSTQFLDDRFERFDLTNLFSTALVPSAPWRQFDFNERAFVARLRATCSRMALLASVRYSERPSITAMVPS